MKEFIKQLQQAYYDGKPMVSNEEYDALIKRFPDAEDNIGQAGEIKHMFRMWSLDKKYPCRGDQLPANLKDYIKTPKLDGCAVDLLYVRGEFEQGLTRGDGIKGRDVTDNLDLIVPAYIDGGFQDHIVMQITGEVVTTMSVANARNYASGAVNLKDDNEFLARVNEGGLTFVAYSIQIRSEMQGVEDWYFLDMSLLRDLGGFRTVVDADINRLCEEGAIPTDGEVYRLNSNSEYAKYGFTNKFPKAAFAVKEDEEGEITTIEDIKWQVGASGKVTPVAIVKEVVLEDAKVTRVTLNNLAYMELMGITHIGQEVRIIRAGGIIPKIVEAY